jgi:hypothetical protein
MVTVAAVRSIGFRCWKDKICFVVLEGPQDRPIVVAAKVRQAPENCSRAEVLCWVRDTVQEVLTDHRPDAVAYKVVEGTAITKDLERAQVEGVMIEAVCAHELHLEPVGRLKSQIKADLGFADEARYIERALHEVGLDQLDTDSKREAALAALSRLSSATDGDPDHI